MNHTEIEIIVALIAGILSGIFSELGSAGLLISLPMLISIGLPPVVANGTNRFGTAALYTAAYMSYQSHDKIDHKSAIIYAIPVIFGTVIGSLWAIKIPNAAMHWLIIAVIVLLAIFSALTQKLESKRNATKNPLDKFNLLTFILLFAIGVYSGLFAQIIAFLVYFVLVKIVGIELKVAEGMKFFIAMIVMPISLIVFVAYGHINWMVAYGLIIGGAIGGYVGEQILVDMPHKATRKFIILSLSFSLLYLLIFMFKNFNDGISFI